VTWRETRHIEAIAHWNAGLLEEAASVWEDILIKHPLDIFALRLVADAYFFLGSNTNILRTAELRLSAFKEGAASDTRLKQSLGYVYGMLAFGFEETFQNDKYEHNLLQDLPVDKPLNSSVN
jgi:hypothetical protein